EKNPSVHETVYSDVYASKEDIGIQVMITSGSFPSEPEVGGFTIEVDGIKGDHLEVDKVYHDTSELRNVPMAKIGLQNVELTGLHLYKNLTLEDGGQIHLRIRTKSPNDKVIISGTGFLSNHLEVFTSEMYAKKLIAKVLFLPIVLNDYWSTAPEEDLLIRLGGTLRVPIEANRMKLNTHVLTAKKMTISNMVLEIGEGHLVSNIP
ncbi:MAG: hypothetical protein IMX04_03800, partial [Candidatus Carbobacillus altaicus]|nr:hypothetical protein [Candidatus Carbobacillus altaicus]